MSEKIQERIADGFALFVIVIVLFFSIIRLFYGVELSDESYAVAETYLVAEGALPYVNNWSQMPGFTMLLAPFVKAYTVIVGGTDGIFLFFRFLSFLINGFTAFMVAYLLKGYVKNRIMLTMIVLIYVGASGCDYVAAFRGDRLAIDLMAIGMLLVVNCLMDREVRKIRIYLSGILSALAVWAYPTFAVQFVYVVILIAFLCFRQKRGYHMLACFLYGAISAGAVMLGYLALNSGMGEIIQGTKYLLKDVTYFQLKNTGLGKVPRYIGSTILQVGRWLYFSADCFVTYALIGVVLFRKRIFRMDELYYSVKRIVVKRTVFLSLITGISVYLLWQVWNLKTADGATISLHAWGLLTLAVPIVYFFVKIEKKICNYLMAFVWFPTYVCVIVTGISTYSGMFGRQALLKNSAFLLGLFTCFAVADVFGKSSKEGVDDVFLVKLFSGLSKLIPVGMMSVISFTFLFNAYTYVYRDESIRLLDTVMTEGPYKGMCTTKIRADGLIELDRLIDEYISKDDYLLAMDNDPFIYLMSKGKMCTPSTWDQALYSYHFDKPDLYYDYFHVTGREPTKIIYFNYGRDKKMSIDVEYKFNDYVNSNYHKIYENRDIFEWEYCKKDNICEVLIYERD
ncbi:hypothetical protein [Selenomonas ruminantium]|uniref:Dolichyl-phosphate-mannose-protein mannosyltransferase n=1 Tax=Selenomonas ruminantium TaxID=971 RepID=A0A1H4AAC0_SELRU|nr:hypothetical protein [Selenomonas ruminantium]SEA32522.1 hypothetical protein SAMN05660648_02784 [Selenomonas ruminantium]